MLSLANSRPAFKKSFAIVAILYRSLTISLLLPLELSFQHAAPPNYCKTFRLIRVEVLW